MPEKIPVILAKDRNPSPEQQSLVAHLLACLEHRPALDVTVVPHLYDLAPEGPAVRFLRSIPDDMIVLAWLYPRSAYWVLEANGIQGRLGRTSSLAEGESVAPAPRKAGRREPPDRTLWCFDLRTHAEPEPYLRQIAQIVARHAGAAQWAEPLAPKPAEPLAAKPNGNAKVLDEPARPRWYPVVDFDRCQGCKECLNFCLFGVYGLDAGGSIFVEQPDACRPGCPACARICSSGAIMFPQHKDPAIAGDPHAPPPSLRPDLLQISLIGGDPASLAAQERARALANKTRSQPEPADIRPDGPPEKASLDSLVDKLDALDL